MNTCDIRAICAHNPMQQRTITASQRTSSSLEAEEMAIALAIISGNPNARIPIVYDSQNPCRQWATGRIGKTTMSRLGIELIREELAQRKLVTAIYKEELIQPLESDIQKQRESSPPVAGNPPPRPPQRV